MPNKKIERNRGSWIPIVMALAFILGFFLIQGGITGLVTLEPTTDAVTFEVNSVIPSTATLEIISGTQKAQITLSELTIKLSDLATIQLILENNSLIAYNITNLTIDLAGYNIKPAETVTIRFVEIYKEITKEITPTEIVVPVITPEVTENITEIVEEIPAENITVTEVITPEFKIAEAITFDRLVTCDKCGQHKVPPLVYVNMTISAISETLLNNTTFADYIPVEWLVINPYNGKVEYIGDGYRRIAWNITNVAAITKSYIVQSPQKTTPPTDYTFKTELANITGAPWAIKVADPTIEFRIQAAIFTENWDDGNDAGWTDNLGFYAPDTGQARSASYSEKFNGNSDGAALLTKDTAIDLTGKINGNASFYAYILSAVDAGEECCLDLSPDGTKWNAGVAGTSDCANGQAGNGANEGIWISVSRPLNSSYYNSNFKIRFNCDSNANGESIYIDDVDVSADTEVFPPVVTLKMPKNSTTDLGVHYVNFTFNASNSGSIPNCSLYLKHSYAGSWERNKTDTSITETVNQSFNITLMKENVYWKVGCYDNEANQGNSSTFNYTVKNAAPTLASISASLSELQAEATQTVTAGTPDDADRDPLDFFCCKDNAGSCTPTEASDICTGGTNEDVAYPYSTTDCTYTVGTTQGTEYVRCLINDDTADSATVRQTTYTVNTVPSILISAPANSTIGYIHSVNFTYNVTDGADTVSNCSLYLKHSYAGSWERNKTDTVINKGKNDTLNITLTHENIYWKVGCYDDFAAQGNSSTFNYTLLQAIPAVNISFPKNNTKYTNRYYINLTYNTTVPGPEIPQSCELYIDGALNKTDYDIEETINQTLNITFSSGTYKWYIRCNASDGWGTAAAFNLSITQQLNVAPTICCRRASTIGAQTINLDSWKSISVTFNVTDADGTDNLKAFANFTGTGADDGDNEYIDYNITCLYTGQSNATSKQFNCSTKIWYWYKPGYWNISVNATDSALWVHNKTMANIDLAQTKAITISPSSLSWPTVNLGTWNITSNNDPIIINNTGNYNVSISKVNVTAYDLHGEAAGYEDEDIPAANFTVSGAAGGTAPNFLECQGTAMVNKTSTNIAISMLPVGNHSIGFKYGTPGNGKTGFENISFCLIDVPNSNMITAGQSYSTAETADWIIGID